MTLDLAGRHVLVVGLGASGQAATSVLRARGASVLAVDGAGAAAMEALAEPGVEVRTGADLDDPGLLADVDLVVVSPGVPPIRGVLSAAVSGEVPVWGEPELAWRLADGRTRFVGITGTNGKTTTTELVAACLGAPVGGNIGSPLVSLLTTEPPPPLVVAELSSFQLHFTPGLATAVGVLLNVAPDHLDWHGSAQAYGDAKARVWAKQAADGVAVVNGDDPRVMALVARRPPPGRVVRFRTSPPERGEVGVSDGVILARLGHAPIEVVPLAESGLPGPHNVANACAAVAASLSAGATVSAVAAAVRAQRLGPHRLEQVTTVRGVAWVNDSKATNPHAAAAALSSYPSVVWIAGGLNKGLEFSELAPLLTGRARGVVTIGAAGPQIAALARRLGLPVVEAGTLAVAVPAAARLAEAGDTVLLAPACASMDQFADYAARGQAFRDAVTRLAADDRPTVTRMGSA